MSVTLRPRAMGGHTSKGRPKALATCLGNRHGDTYANIVAPTCLRNIVMMLIMMLIMMLLALGGQRSPPSGRGPLGGGAMGEYSAPRRADARQNSIRVGGRLC